MKKFLIVLAVLLLISGWVIYARLSSAVRQPLGFSHSEHVNAKIPCSTCHQPDSVDNLPGTENCKNCHSEKLQQQVSWVRIYRVAPDIIFTHNNHRNTSCATCHQAVSEGRRFVYRSGFTMKFCMDCHARENAENLCATCHKNR